jgi:SHS2 domain-containing protein
VRQVGRLDIDGLTLRAEVQGERFDPTRHQVKLEIKTPTYHMFRLEPTPTGWQATVLFDV